MRVPNSRAEHGVRVPKRARTHPGDSAPDCDDDGETRDQGECLPGAMPPLPHRPCAPHDGAAVRSRSARRKALKRARRRQMLEVAPTTSPCAKAAHAPALVSLPIDAYTRYHAHDAAVIHSVVQHAPVLLPADESTTSDSYDGADGAVPDGRNTLDRAASEELHAFERWVAGETSTFPDIEPPRMDLHALRVGDVISYCVVELSATG